MTRANHHLIPAAPFQSLLAPACKPAKIPPGSPPYAPSPVMWTAASQPGPWVCWVSVSVARSGRCFLLILFKWHCFLPNVLFASQHKNKGLVWFPCTHTSSSREAYNGKVKKWPPLCPGTGSYHDAGTPRLRVKP